MAQADDGDGTTDDQGSGRPTPVSSSASDGRRDRAIGAVMGLACGDAVGTTLEFRAPGTFEPIGDMVGGGPFGLAPGQWTDDTSMALCLAESLLDRGDLDPADQMRRYGLWRRQGYLSSTGTCFDIGTTVSRQLSRFEATGEAIDPRPDPQSAANGSLMRLAPVPVRWHTDVAEAADRSGASSRTTHGARRPVDACRVLGAMVAALVGGEPAPSVLAEGFWRWGELDPEIAAVARGSWRHKDAAQIRGTGFCVDALEAAIWAVAGADDFRGAVLRAANLGDDADTTAAIAGQLAGARWGASGIPAEWRSRIVLRERIEAMAAGLHDAALGSVDATAPRSWAHDAFVHAWWVPPGVLAGEYPSDAQDAERARQKVDILVDAGVRSFVDLTTAGELRPSGHLHPYADVVAAVGDARRLDLRHARFPIPDFDVIDDAGYDDVVRHIVTERERGVVYVHCWGGVGRTGTVVGCLLLHDRLDGGDVVTRLAGLRAGTRKAHRPSPESAPQHEVLRRRAHAG